MVKFNYCRKGRGTPLVLLHSLGQRWQTWLPVLDRLSERHEVMAVDLPFFGDARFPPGASEDSIRSFAANSLGAILSHLRVERPHVAGLGLGGMLAAASATTDLIASATAVAPVGFWTTPQRAWTLTHLRMFQLATCTARAAEMPPMARQITHRAILSRLCNFPAQLDREEAVAHLSAMQDAPAFSRAIRAANQFTWTAECRPTVPLTIAWGQRDRMLSPRQAARAARLLGAELVLLPDCGHLAMSDQPNLLADTILRTCARAEHSPQTHT